MKTIIRNIYEIIPPLCPVAGLIMAEIVWMQTARTPFIAGLQAAGGVLCVIDSTALGFAILGYQRMKPGPSEELPSSGQSASS